MRLDTQGLLIRSQGSTYKKSAHLNNVYLIRRQEEEERMNLFTGISSETIYLGMHYYDEPYSQVHHNSEFPVYLFSNPNI